MKIVTRDEVVWEDAPDRDEAGSPNVVGAVALAVALDAVGRLGFDLVEGVERDLTHRVLEGLRSVPSVTVLGNADPDDLADRLGVVSFVMEGVHHGLLASILANEWGIGIRNGCFCAHPYLLDLLRVGSAEAAATRIASSPATGATCRARAGSASHHTTDPRRWIVSSRASTPSRRVESLSSTNSIPEAVISSRSDGRPVGPTHSRYEARKSTCPT